MKNQYDHFEHLAPYGPSRMTGEKSALDLFFLANGDVGIVNCEVKSGDAPDLAKLELALEVLVAYRNGVRIFG